MKNDAAIYSLAKLSTQNLGVFSLSDIRKIFDIHSPATLYRKVNSLVENGIIKKVTKGYYADQNATLSRVAMRIFPDGYVSLGYALAKHGLVGSFPKNKINILTSRVRSKVIDTDFGKIKMSVQEENLHFDFSNQDGLRIASPEKAFIDTLYFYLRGERYQFDVYSEINRSMLDRSRVKKILEKYKNPKFISFVEGVLSNG